MVVKSKREVGSWVVEALEYSHAAHAKRLMSAPFFASWLELINAISPITRSPAKRQRSKTSLIEQVVLTMHIGLAAFTNFSSLF